MTPVDILITRLDPDLPLPAYEHPGDAGLDLRSRVDVVAGARRAGTRADRHRHRPSTRAASPWCARAAGWRCDTGSAW